MKTYTQIDSQLATGTAPLAVDSTTMVPNLNVENLAGHTMAQLLADFLLLAHPVGEIFESVVSTSPATLFGGTWAVMSGAFLIGADGTTYVAGATGGATTVTLTTAMMPDHTHVQNSHNHTQDSHNHTQNSHNHTQNAHTHQTQGYFSAGSTSITSKTPSKDYISTDPVTTNSSIRGATATNIGTTATNIATTATNQATTAVNQNTGGGGAHPNMPPYLVVYRWKRTA